MDEAGALNATLVDYGLGEILLCQHCEASLLQLMEKGVLEWLFEQGHPFLMSFSVS